MLFDPRIAPFCPSILREFFLPTAPEVKPQEHFRGCLFIALDDDANDMESLLGIIYDGL
jgi:hypothetical protein